VHLDRREAGVEQGVADSHARVRVRRGVDDDPVETPLRRLEPLDDLPLVVRLKKATVAPSARAADVTSSRMAASVSLP